ncbi:hypothetical protein ACTNDN_06650 [Niallia sp. HCP3S3_B10]|uniref:hypothetical protein n=1 Tax=Niallia sp. HCP3S3_B10 TaxID=3438944 RepID=UPI003F8ACF77
MFDIILYTIPAILLVMGLIMYFIGRSKKNNKLKGVGIGLIICLIVLESPSIIQGFIEGFTDGYRGYPYIANMGIDPRRIDACLY